MSDQRFGHGSIHVREHIAKYLPVYFVLLGIAALEIFLAYRNLSPVTLLVVLLALAICGAASGADVFHALEAGAPQPVPVADSRHDFCPDYDERHLVRQFSVSPLKPFAH